MKAMILAAGKGERLRPLTDNTPKPMLKVGGKPLLQYHIENLADAGITDLVLNTGKLGGQIESYFGCGKDFGVAIAYSKEGEKPLETGGGIKRALPLLGPAPFIVINADIWTDFPLSSLPVSPKGLAHLIMVNNPLHNPEGDFVLEQGVLRENGADRITFSGIGVYRPELFPTQNGEVFPLAPLLRQAMRKEQVSGEHFSGQWIDAGTKDRLQLIENTIKNKK